MKIHTVPIDIDAFSFSVEDLYTQFIGLVGIQQEQPGLLWIIRCQVNFVMQTCRYHRFELRQTFLACVTMTPTVVLRAVDQINVTLTGDSDRRQTPCFRIMIQALNDEELVGEPGTHVSVHDRIKCTLFRLPLQSAHYSFFGVFGVARDTRTVRIGEHGFWDTEIAW